MFDACPVHPKGTMVIPMLWRISEYVVCMMGVKNKNHHTHPYLKGIRSSYGRGHHGRHHPTFDANPSIVLILCGAAGAGFTIDEQGSNAGNGIMKVVPYPQPL